MAGWKFTSDAPIYLQIVEKMKQRIVSGLYDSGEQLPTVRELAAEAGVNPNTVQRAFAELEGTGLVHSNRTSGRFITEDKSLIDELKTTFAKAEVDIFFGKMTMLGFEKDEIVRIIENYKEEKHE